MKSSAKLSFGYFFLSLCAVVAIGCNGSGTAGRQDVGQPEPTDKPTVTAIHYSTASILQAISGDQFDVFFPNPGQGNVPTDQEIDQMQSSSLIVISGKHQASWIDTVTLPESKKYQTAGAILEEFIHVDNLGSHQHGPGESHSHDGTVSETWLSPRLFQKQTQSVLDQLVRREFISKEQANKMKERYQEIFQPLLELAKKTRRENEMNWLVDHAGAEYLCRDLNFKTTILELKEGFEKDPTALKKSLQKWIKENPSTGVILTQPQSPKVLELLAELKIKTIQVDLIHSGPFQEKNGANSAQDYVQRMQKNYANFGNFEEK